MSNSDLFKWTKMTEDLQPPKKQNKFSKPRSKQNVEAWLDNASVGGGEADRGCVPSGDVGGEDRSDDIDVWLNKVRKAADIAKSDVVLGCQAEEETDQFEGSNEPVSALFSRIISDYIPDYSAAEDVESRDLLLEDKHDTVTEAKSILNSWLSKKCEIDREELMFDEEDYYEYSRTLQSTHTALPPGEPVDDVLAALNQLRSAPIEKTVMRHMKGKRKMKNPAVSMATRQEQAKERRRQLEEERLSKMKCLAERKAARAEAERVILEEQSKKEFEEKREEAKIQEEMVALRKRLREEQQHKMMSYEKQREEQTASHKAELAAEYRRVVMETAEEEVKRKQLLATRHILLKQLQEAERREMKERYNLLQSSFTKWRERILDSKVLYNKAAAYHEWRTQLRTWQHWRRHCQEESNKREEKIRKAMFRENKHARIADLHYQKSHTRHYFKYWLCWKRARIQEKREKEEETRRHRLMEQCLAAAAELSQKTGDYDKGKYQKKKKLAINFGARRRNEEAKTRRINYQETDTCDQETDNCDQETDNCDQETDNCDQETEDCDQEKENCDQEKDGDNHYADNERYCEAHIPVTREVRPCSAVVTSATSQSVALHHSTHHPAPLNPWDSEPSHRAAHGSTAEKREMRTESKVPAALRGMEERARQRQQRQLEIQERKEEKKRQKEIERMEEERRKFVQEEARKKKEKEERLREIAAARQREQERLQEVEILKEKTIRAINHYHSRLQLKFVIRPLKNLCDKVERDRCVAVSHYTTTLTARCWRTWEGALSLKETKEEGRAQEHDRMRRMRSAFRALARAVNVQDTYTRLAVRHYRRVLRVRCLQAWHIVTKENMELRAGREEQAARMDDRLTARRHLLSWKRLTPHLKRERDGEARRAQMRSVVADLLPDYNPPVL